MEKTQKTTNQRNTAKTKQQIKNIKNEETNFFYLTKVKTMKQKQINNRKEN